MIVIQAKACYREEYIRRLRHQLVMAAKSGVVIIPTGFEVVYVDDKTTDSIQVINKGEDANAKG